MFLEAQVQTTLDGKWTRINLVVDTTKDFRIKTIVLGNRKYDLIETDALQP